MTAKSAKLLHTFIYGTDASRKNRPNLRKFTGFTFQKDTEEYNEKIKFIEEQFSEGEITTICSLLGKDCEDELHDTIKKLIGCFIDLRTLSVNDEDKDDEDDDDDDDADNEDDINSKSSEDDNVRNEDENKINTEAHNDPTMQINKQWSSCAISFKDVEDMLRPFDGKSNYSIEQWIADYEELTTMLNCNELQRFLFAKKSLRGLARLFISSEKNVNTWSKLKKSLLTEFGLNISAADIHKALMKRKMKQEENVYEYFLHMKEIASRGDIDSKSLMQYVIEGINDTPANKMMLYGSENLKEFKSKLQHYSAYRDGCIENKINKFKKQTAYRDFENKGDNEDKKILRCFNCGELGHRAVECVMKEKGIKCFKCGAFGHKAPQCREVEGRKYEKTSENTAVVNSVITPVVNRMCKSISINGIKFSALIDTGSAVNIIRQDAAGKAELKDVNESSLSIYGFGGKKIDAIGSVQENVILDDEEYNVVFQIVPNGTMPDEIIFGSPLLDQSEIIVNKDNVIIKKLNEESNKVDLLNITNKVMRNEIEDSGGVGTLMSAPFDETEWKARESQSQRELEEEKARAAQMQKTMKWSSDTDYTVNWREKWSKVRNERNKVRNEAEQLRVSLEAAVKESNSYKREKDDLELQITQLKKEMEKIHIMKHAGQFHKSSLENGKEQRRINATPSELLFEIKTRSKEDIRVKEVIEEEVREMFCEKREKFRKEAKKSMQKIQQESKKYYDKKRKPALKYKVGDIVAVKRVQLGPVKLWPRFLGPYQVLKVKQNDTYDVKKFGIHEGPQQISTCAEYMETWVNSLGSNGSRMAEL